MHSLNRRIFLRASVTAGSGVLVASCRAASPATPAPSRTGPTPASNSTPGTRGTAAPVAAGGPTDLTVWFQLPGSQGKVVQSIADDFNHSQNRIAAHVTIVPGATIWTKLVTAVAGGQPPDVVHLNSAQLIDFALSQDAVALNTLGPETAQWDLFPINRDVVTFSGQMMAAPINGGLMAYYYNADLYQQAGLDPDKPPATWDQLLETARKIANPAKQQWGHLVGTSPISWTAEVWWGYLWSNGGEVLTPDNSAAAFNAAAGVEALQFWVDLIHKYKVTPLIPIDALAMGNTFSTGKVGGMTVWPIWVQAAAHMRFRARTAQLPHGKGTSSTLYAGASLAISKGSKHHGESWALLKYLMSPGPNTKWNIGLGTLPSRKTVLDSAAFQGYLKKQPLLDPFFAGIAAAKTLPKVHGAAAIEQTVADAIETALYQRASPKQALDTAAAKVNAILKKGGAK